MPLQRRRPDVSQTRGARFHLGLVELRHARSRGAGTGRIRKDVQERQAALFHEPGRILKMGFGLSRETGNDVRAEGDVRPNRAETICQRNGVIARMPPLHALQDQIVSVLKGQMHEGRKSRFRHGLHQGIIYLDGVNGGNA